MNHIEYSALNYYHSPVSDECLCIGIIFHNITTGQRDFRYISNFNRFQAFDDEADIDFVKLYLKGIKDDVENNLLNYNSKFDLKSYIYFFANEFRFSCIKKLNVEDDEDYVEDITKIYLKYDIARSQRLNANEEKKLIRRVLKENSYDLYSSKILGEFNDEITFDFHANDLCIKFFSFKGKDLKRLVSSARQWSFVASELANEKKVLFIYETDYRDTVNLNLIIKILSKHAKVLQYDAGIDFIVNHGTPKIV